MTLEQVTQLFSPAQESLDTITNWLAASGINASRVSQSTNKQVGSH
jgi:hypothetical protein